jgi:hypothetical protein
MEEPDLQHAMKMISMVTPKTSKDLQLQNALSFDVLSQGCMFFLFVLSERKLSMSSAQFGPPHRIFCILHTNSSRAGHLHGYEYVDGSRMLQCQSSVSVLSRSGQ